MGAIRQRVKKGKNEFRLSGYELGAGIRKAIKAKTRSTGNALNSLQHRIGVRTMSLLLAIIWLVAFYYFVDLLFPFI
ncbi:hypothetical protein [Salmonirosea aquatica]|uniref:Uncharacterized protein n=1 Tax=Salmonirosea aquatica TaxID=2654236 RepID=A0A7C9FG78_9BACT|nr:hypothetical protein [Cytophagaceae bacterium SJW1-29]